MKTLFKWLLLSACLAAGNARGEFVKPTREQLKAAAEDPAKVVELLKDASIDQSAELAKDVVIQIVKLDLEPDERDKRISLLVSYLFMTMPEDQWDDLAISLGKFVAASPTASMSPDTISAFQRAIIELAGVSVGSDFGNAYNLAMQTIAGAPGGGKTVPPQPPPPPVALPYEGQRLL